MSQETPPLTAPTPTLPEIQGPVREELARVAEAVEQVLFPGILDSRAVLDLVRSAGGNSLHPSVLLLAAKASGQTRKEAVTLAAGCELFHLATWVHDAAVDDLPVEGWSRDRMVIDGDHIFSSGLTLLAGASERAADAAARMIGRMVLGELEYLREGPESSPQEHLDMILNKHGALLGASCELAVVDSNIPEGRVDSLREYGKHLGVAYMIGQEILGFREVVLRGRMNLPLLYTRGSSARRTRMIEERDAEGLFELCSTDGGFEEATREAGRQASMARAALLESGIGSAPMEEITTWVTRRMER